MMLKKFLSLITIAILCFSILSCKDRSHSQNNSPSKNKEKKPETIPSKVPDKKPETIPSKLPEKKPETIPSKLPEKKPETIPSKLPEKKTEQVFHSKHKKNSHSNKEYFSKGLPNLGSTCYMNSLISLFSSYPFFTEGEDSLSHNWVKLIKELKSFPSDTMAPESLMQKFASLIGHEGQDDPFEAILNKMTFPFENTIHVRESTSRNFDVNLDMNKRVPLTDFIRTNSSHFFQYISVIPQSSSFMESLSSSYLVNDENISDENHKDLLIFKTRSLALIDETSKPPKQIIFRLNRFLIDDFGQIQKILDKVSTEDNINLKFYLGESSSLFLNYDYELVGSIIHLGDSPRTGHYISRIKHGDTWFVHNDSRVYPESEESGLKDIQDHNAYLLLYHLKSAND